MELDELQAAYNRVTQNLNFQNAPLQSGEDLNHSLQFEQRLTWALEQEAKDLRPRLWSEFQGVGPLEPLLHDSEVTEVVVNGTEAIWFEKSNCFQKFDDRFLSERTMENFFSRMGQECGLNVNLKFPCGDADWRGFRAHVVRPPLSPSWQLTLRGRPIKPWNFERLQKQGWASESELSILKTWLKEKKNLLIVGPTGAGKTSVLNACLQELDHDERVITLEDVPELSPRSSSSCRLYTRHDEYGQLREFQLSDLLRQALRMRPHRLVLGEVRGGEAKDLLLSLATGHRGSLGTLHAASARQALLRLEMLVQLGAGQWDQQAIRQLILLSLDGMVVTGFKNGERSLEGLYRLAALESCGFLIEPCA